MPRKGPAPAPRVLFSSSSCRRYCCGLWRGRSSWKREGGGRPVPQSHAAAQVTWLSPPPLPGAGTAPLSRDGRPLAAPLRAPPASRGVGVFPRPRPRLLCAEFPRARTGVWPGKAFRLLRAAGGVKWRRDKRRARKAAVGVCPGWFRLRHPLRETVVGVFTSKTRWGEGWSPAGEGSST